MDSSWDCIVIGGGAAGLSAALVLGRARRRTLLLDAGGQSNLAAEHIGGLLGFDQRPAPELYARGREELAAYPTVEVRDATALAVRPRGDGSFEVDLAAIGGSEPRRNDGAAGDGDATTEATARVILAMGADYEPPAIPGLAERFGGSVFHCPFCHGWEHRDGALGVLDPGPHGADRALMLTAWSDDVTLYTGGEDEVADDVRARLVAAGVVIEERAVVAAEGADGAAGVESAAGAAGTISAEVSGRADALARIRFADGEARACTGLLVPVTLAQRGTFADDLGIDRQTEGPWAGQTLVVSPMGTTNVPGISAAGDCATANPSVANAIASGALAAAGVVHGLTIAAAAVGAAR